MPGIPALRRLSFKTSLGYISKTKQIDVGLKDGSVGKVPAMEVNDSSTCLQNQHCKGRDREAAGLTHQPT